MTDVEPWVLLQSSGWTIPSIKMKQNKNKTTNKHTNPHVTCCFEEKQGFVWHIDKGYNVTSQKPESDTVQPIPPQAANQSRKLKTFLERTVMND